MTENKTPIVFITDISLNKFFVRRNISPDDLKITQWILGDAMNKPSLYDFLDIKTAKIEVCYE